MKEESEGGGLGGKEEDLIGRASEHKSEKDSPVPLGALHKGLSFRRLGLGRHGKALLISLAQPLAGTPEGEAPQL